MNAEGLATHLRQLEEELLCPGVRRDPQRLKYLLAEDFREFGSSGSAFERAAILADLAAEAPAQLSLTDFTCQQLAAGVALVTYRSQRTDASGTRQALRSSVWIFRDGRWQILFHQGTRI